MRSHLEMQTQEYIEAGMKPDEARHAAMRQFGWTESIKETCREQRGLVWLENWYRDCLYAGRMLRKNPGFTVAAVLTLALGIGATTAIFSVINTVLLRPLPYQDPERLVWLYQNKPQRELLQFPMGTQKFQFWREHCQSFQQLALVGPADFQLTDENSTELVHGLKVTANLCDLLGIQPLLGRSFRPEENVAGSTPVAILSHRLWQRRFAGEPGIIGKTIREFGRSYTVVGVLPPEFRFPIGAMPAWRVLPNGDPDIWLPAKFSRLGEPDGETGFVIGRLEPGVRAEQAQAEMRRVTELDEAAYPKTEGWSVDVVPVREQVSGQVRPALLLLMGAVSAVLLIACVNVAGLLLARSLHRQKEFAVRVAIGAGRFRLASQLLIECLLLASLGGGLGVLAAFWLVRALVGLSSVPLPRVEEIGVDARVAAFTTGVSVFAGLSCALVPLWQLLRQDFGRWMLGREKISTRHHGPGGLQEPLIVVQVALSLVLLISAGLLLRSFARVMSSETGYRPQRVLAMNLALRSPRYLTNAAKDAATKELLERLETLPGVSAAGFSFGLPLAKGISIKNTFKVEGRPPESGQDGYLNLRLRIVSRDYFAALRIPVLRGRGFSLSSSLGGEKCEVLLNQSAARLAFPDEEPIGKLCNFGPIVGIVADTLDIGLDRQPEPQFFIEGYSASEAFLVIGSTTAPEAVKAAVVREIAAVDKDLVVLNVKTMEQMVSDSLAPRRFQMTLLALFALAALLLTAIGIFGRVAWSVSQRTKEIGVRIALGAQYGDVWRLILHKGMIPVSLGMIAGVLGAWAATRLLANQLFEVTATDPMTIVCVSVLVLGIALLACWLPARRAARTDPMVALRHE